MPGGNSERFYLLLQRPCWVENRYDRIVPFSIQIAKQLKQVVFGAPVAKRAS